MLMPSAFSCDQGLVQPKPERPARPKLPSFERYEPRQQVHSPVAGLIASCRALHSMLGERFSTTPSPSLEATLSARPIGSPFGEHPPILPARPPAPRGANKRSRDEFEDSDVSPGTSSCSSSSSNSYHAYITPKRRRTIPLNIPRGLLESDFEALSCDDAQGAYGSSQEDVEMPQMMEISATPTATCDKLSAWSENDDRLLVETVLAKLRLSSRDWNECAARLGKDKDSIGRRWRLLLGEGDVGLRRGSGRMDRVDLDIKSW